jgi:hypothetical protein
MAKLSCALVLVSALSVGCVFDEEGDWFGDDDESGDPVGPGDSGAPLYPCGGESDQANDPLPGGEVICFDTEIESETPAATIEHAFETYDGVEAIHIRLIFDPGFVDNTYGVGSMGWEESKKGIHTFKELVGSDHAELVLLDADDEVVFDLKLDYLSEDPDAPCGYSSGGVSDGDGKVLGGDADAVLGWMTSLDRNLNEYGYCDYVTDSPLTDDICTPNAEAPYWDFRVVYEVWVRADAFEPVGFGTGHIDSVHASPSKGPENTIIVIPGDCPCNDPDGCDNEPGDPPGDPNDPPDVDDECVDDSDCPVQEFCHESGSCLPDIG